MSPLGILHTPRTSNRQQGAVRRVKGRSESASHLLLGDQQRVGSRVRCAPYTLAERREARVPPLPAPMVNRS